MRKITAILPERPPSSLSGAAQAQTILKASHQSPAARATCATTWCR